MRVRCPKCRLDQEAGPDPSGRFVCAACGQKMRAAPQANRTILVKPSEEEETPAPKASRPAPHDPPPAELEEDEPSPPSRPAWLIPVIAAVCIMALAGGALLTVALSRGPTQRPSPKSVPATSQISAREPSVGEAAGAGIAGMACFGVFFVLPLIYVVLLILLIAWVARDCRSRGVDGSAVWVLVIFLTGPIGLIVYMASRPHGFLVSCQRCRNRRLEAAMSCPHCGVRVGD